MDASNLRKALLKMEADGLVVREYREHPVWNAIAGDVMDKVCLCFWNAASMEQDKQAIAEDERRSEARRADGEDAFMRAFGRFADKTAG